MEDYLRNKRVKTTMGEVEFEEIFLDKQLKERGKETEEVADRKLEIPLRKINFLILLLLGITLIGVLFFTVFKLQIQEHKKYELLAQENKFFISFLSAERGVLYDRNRKQLVWNEANFELLAKKSKIPGGVEGEQILKEVSALLGEDIESLKKKLRAQPADEVVVAKNLGHKSLILFETKKAELLGFEVKKRVVRHYETEGKLGPILGYLGKISPLELKELQGYELNDYVGKEGLERVYEKVLAERKGRLQIERTAEGREVSRRVIAYPKTGDSLLLSLDLSLQRKIVEAMEKVLHEVKSDKGAAVALDPRNGEVLALVSLPSFDNNLFSRGISQEDLEKLNQDKNKPQLNRAIAGLYPTGSSIKPVVALAALEEGLIGEATELYCPLQLCIENIYTKGKDCFPDWQFHGWTDVKKAIAESVNPFFYIIGGGYRAPAASSEFFDRRLPRNFEGLGLRRLSYYFRLFGFGKKTGIDLPGELAGKVPDASRIETWYLGDTYNLSIGQGDLLATPLQMAVAIGAIANDGKMFKPKLLKEVLPSDGRQMQGISAEVLAENLASKETLRIIKEGMRQAVASPSGSAHSLNSLMVKVAAKTGTAQIYPKKEIYHNWLVAFAPDEAPEIVLVVLIEEVKGTRVAAQKVAKEVLEWYFGQESEIKN